MNNREYIFDTIKERKRSIGMTNYRLSALTGMTQYNIRRVDKGFGFTVDNLIKICNALNLTIKLIDNNEKDNSQSPLDRALACAE